VLNRPKRRFLVRADGGKTIEFDEFRRWWPCDDTVVFTMCTVDGTRIMKHLVRASKQFGGTSVKNRAVVTAVLFNTAVHIQ
jgi:hypothetical protein